MSKGYIAVDLDGTLAHYDVWVSDTHIGEPIAPMVERVKQWLAEGRQVKIFTARVGYHPLSGTLKEVRIAHIRRWCLEHIGQELEVTNEKTYDMIEFWDDRAVQVEPNTGEPVTYWQSRAA